MFLIFLLYALFGSSFTISKLVLEYARPLTFLGTRMLIAGIILAIIQWRRDRASFMHARQFAFTHVNMIIFGMLATYGLRLWAIQYLPSFKTAFLYNISPFVAALLSYIRFGERLTQQQWIGLLIGFVGLIPMLVYGSGCSGGLAELCTLSIPELAIFVSATTHCYSWIQMRSLVKDHDCSPITTNAINMVGCGVISLALSFMFEQSPHVMNMNGYLGCAIIMILVSNLLCHNLYAYLLRYYTTTLMSFAGFLTPFFSALYGVWFLNEHVTWHFYASSLIVLLGLAIFYREELLSSRAMHNNEPVIIDDVGE